MTMPELLIDGAPPRMEDLASQALVNYGAYTSFALEEGGVRGLGLHLARLEASSLALFGETVGENRLRSLIQQAVGERTEAWLRVSLFAPEITARTPDWVGPPRVMTAVSPRPAPLAVSARLGVQTFERDEAHLKHTAIFGLIRARRAAKEQGFEDSLFVDAEGRISEGSLWNIGFLKGDRVIWTQGPMLDGVARSLIDRGLPGQGLRSETRTVRLSDLTDFDGAFLCNSATPACAVSTIGDHAFDADPERVRAISEAWASNSAESIAAAAR
jgi:branched-subunit amino acid aminotransferase/4-amino-4-deoxychorismate lyase